MTVREESPNVGINDLYAFLFCPRGGCCIFDTDRLIHYKYITLELIYWKFHCSGLRREIATRRERCFFGLARWGRGRSCPARSPRSISFLQPSCVPPP